MLTKIYILLLPLAKIRETPLRPGFYSGPGTIKKAFSTSAGEKALQDGYQQAARWTGKAGSNA
jgi:hypothetical protein